MLEEKAANNNSTVKPKFNSSFRIIAKQNRIQKYQNAFVLDSDFDVLYTIDCMPEYETYLKRHRSEYDADPKDWTHINNTYQTMAKQIKLLMPKMPMCRSYFAKLGVINFFCYYFKTLKEMHRVPVLPAIPRKEYRFPDLLPPLPIHYTQVKKIPINMKQMIAKLSQQQKNDLSKQIVDKAKNRATTIDRSIVDNIKSVIKKHFLKEFHDFNDQALDKYVLQIINGFSKGIGDLIQQISTLRMAIEKNIKQNKGQILFCEKKIKENYADYEKKLKKEVANRINELPHNAEIKQQAIDAVQAAVKQDLQNHLQKFRQDGKAGLDKIAAGQQRLELLIKDPLADKHLDEFSEVFDIRGFIFEIPTEKMRNEQPDSIRLLGGCVVSLQEQALQKSILAKELVNKRLGILINGAEETFTNVKYEQSYYAFKLKTKSFLACHQYEYQWIKDAFIQPKQDQKFKDYLSLLDKKDFTAVKNKFHKNFLMSRDANGLSLLHRAVLTKDLKIFELIVSFYQRVKGDLSVCDEFEQTALHLAATHGLSEMIDILLASLQEKQRLSLLNRCMQTGANALHLAIIHNQLKAIKQLLKANINCRYKLNNGMTPLYTAIHHQYEECALLLLQYPVDVKAELANGTTALYTACELGMLSVVEQMLKLPDIDVNHQRKDKKSALYTAVRHQQIAVTELLLAMPDIVVNISLNFGNTPLHAASEVGNARLINMLLAQGADPNAKDVFSETPLIYAIRNGNFDCALRLCKNTMIATKNQFGDNAAHIAAQYGLFNLIHQGMNSIDAKMLFTVDHFKKNMFHYLVANGRYDLVDFYYKRIDADAQRHLYQHDHHKFFWNVLRSGQKQMMAYLIINNAILRTKDKQKINLILHYSAQFGYLDLLEHFSVEYDEHHELPGGKNLAYIAAAGGQTHALARLIDKEIPLSCSAGHCLIAAVKSGVFGTIEKVLLEVTEDPNNIFDKNGNNFLHTAAYMGNPLLLIFLRERGADFNRVNKRNYTVFHIVANCGAEKAWDYLTNKKDKFVLPNDLAYFLARKNKGDMLKTVLTLAPQTAHYIEPNTKNTLLHAAVISRDVELLTWCQERFPQMSNVSNKNKFTPLALAVQLKLNDIVKVLLPKIKEQLTTISQQQLFTIAFNVKSMTIIKMLLDQYGVPTIQFPVPQTQLLQNFSATLEKVKQFVKLLSNLEVHEAKKIARTLDWSLYYPIQCSIGPLQITGEYNLLQIALLFDNEEMIDWLIDRGFSMDISNGNADTPFHDLVRNKKLFALKMALPRYPKGIIKNHQDVTLMHLAVSIYDLEILKYLHKIDSVRFSLNDADVNGMCPSHYATLHGNEEAIEWMIEQSLELDALDHFNQTPLSYAISNGFKNMVELLCRHGVNLERKITRDQTSYLHLAIIHKKMDIAFLLLEYGIAYNEPDLAGVLPIHLAVQNEMLALVKLLIARGADANARDIQNRTCLHYAASNKKTQVAEYLLSHGANPNIPTKKYFYSWEEENQLDEDVYPQHLAALHGNVAMIKLLLRYGARAEQTTHSTYLINNNTMISYAFQAPSVSPDVISLCKKYNLHRSHRDDYLSAVIIKDHSLELESILEDKENSLKMQQGWHALHYAAQVNAERCTQLILKHDSNALASASLGQEQPLHMAIQHGNLGVAKLFLRHNPLSKEQLSQLLFLAVNSGHAAMVVLILLCNAPCTPNAEGQQILSLAMKTNQESIPYLLAAGANPNFVDLEKKEEGAHDLVLAYKQHQQKYSAEPALHQALRLNNQQGFYFLLNYQLKHKVDDKGDSIGHLAISLKTWWAFNAIQQHHMFVEVKNLNDLTPLMIALSLYSIAELNALKAYGIPFTKQDAKQTDLLEYCYRHRLHVSFEWLLREAPDSFRYLSDACLNEIIKDKNGSLFKTDLFWDQFKNEKNQLQLKGLIRLYIRESHTLGYIKKHLLKFLSHAVKYNKTKLVSCFASEPQLYTYKFEPALIHRALNNNNWWVLAQLLQSPYHCTFIKDWMSFFKKMAEFLLTYIQQHKTITFDSYVLLLIKMMIEHYNLLPHTDQTTLKGIFAPVIIAAIKQHLQQFIKPLLHSPLYNRSFPINILVAATKDNPTYALLVKILINHDRDLSTICTEMNRPGLWKFPTDRTFAEVLLLKAIELQNDEAIQYLKYLPAVDLTKFNLQQSLYKATTEPKFFYQLFKIGANPFIVEGKETIPAIEKLQNEPMKKRINDEQDKMIRQSTGKPTVEQIKNSAFLLQAAKILVVKKELVCVYYLVNCYFNSKLQSYIKLSPIKKSHKIQQKYRKLQGKIITVDQPQQELLSQVLANSQFARR